MSRKKLDDRAKIETQDPYRLLALRMIQATKGDIWSGDINREWFAYVFAKSDWFCVVCGAAGLDPEYTRAAIFENGGRQ